MTAKRAARLDAIRELVRDGSLRTQGQLVDALRKRGFTAAQATISRDIAVLGLRKGADGAYALAEDKRLQALVTQVGLAVRRAANQVVVITEPGSAPSVAAAIDAAAPDGVLGSIAGDDTVLVIAKDEEAAQNVEESMVKMFEEPKKHSRKGHRNG